MALRPRYAVLLALAAGAAVVLAALPPSTRLVPWTVRSEATDGYSAYEEARAERSAMIGLMRRLALRDSISTSLPVQEVAIPSIVFAPDVSEPTRAAIEEGLREHWRLIRIDSALVPVVIVALTDSAAGRSAYEPRIQYVIPGHEASIEDRCVSIVQLREVSALPSRVRVVFRDGLRAQSVLGPCAFFAAFGKPGSGTAKWLTERGHAVALKSDWSAARSHPLRTARDENVLTPLYGNSSMSDWGLDARSCRSGYRDACLASILVPLRFRPFGEPDYGLVASRSAENDPWRSSSSHLLADLVVHMGRERFAQFWRSDAPPETAYAEVMGRDMRQWAYQWVVEHHGRSAPGARIPASFVLIGSLLGCGSLGAAILMAARRQVR